MAIACLTTWGAIARDTHAAALSPNVILIVTDDQGYGDMACHGNPWLKTPNLDRLHEQSVCLEDYHVDPVCTPTRAALMTGRYCTRVGAWAVTEGRQLLNPDETTMAEVFAASGYRTAMFGKWHLGDPYPYAPRFRGFQQVVRNRAGGVGEIGNPAGNDYFDDTYFRNGRPEHFTGYCTDVWFREALRFIRDTQRAPAPRPFFVYLPLNAMHSPFNVAAKYWKPFAAQGLPEDRARFYGMIENFDENLGRLLQALRELDLEHDTMVIFMGDNGTAAGLGSGRTSQGGFNAGMRGKKGSVYEGGHRVACFVRWPAQFQGGHRVQALTAHFDWLPTLIELCRLQAPTEVKFDGRSIARLLRGDTTGWPNRTLFVERQADQVRKWTPTAPKSQYPQLAALSEHWRLVNGELYDLSTDPGQKRDVAAQHPNIVQRLLAAYARHFDDVFRPGGADTRFWIGAPEENPTRFTVRDWHPTAGHVIWKPGSLADDDLFINGFWAVKVLRAGRYTIRLSRYPDDDPHPMGASEARIKLGSLIQTKPVSPVARSVTFEFELPPGPVRLQTWLKDTRTGRERGAYFISINWRDRDKSG